MITTCFKPKKTRKNCTFLKSFFKKSYFNLFNNKSLIFFDNLIAKELYFSKLCHLWVLEYVFIGKFYVCRVLTVKKQAVCTFVLPLFYLYVVKVHVIKNKSWCVDNKNSDGLHYVILMSDWFLKSRLSNLYLTLFEVIFQNVIYICGFYFKIHLLTYFLK